MTIRELSSKDWETLMAEATESLSSSRRLPSIQLPVTNCINGGRTSTNCDTVRSQNINLVTNRVQKQSLSELVTSLRNCSSARTQASTQMGLPAASTLGNASSRSSVPHSSPGNLLELDSLRAVETAPLKLHHSNSGQKYSLHSAAATRQALNVPESRSTPSQVTGAKFHFKRTPTTPVQSQVQSSVYPNCSAGSVATSSRNQPGSLMVSSTAASSHTANAVNDMWDTGKPSLTASLSSMFYFKTTSK